MKDDFRFEENALIWEQNHEIIKLQPWGKDSLRVRSTKNPHILDQPWALLVPPPETPECEIAEEAAILRNGKIQARITVDGRLFFTRTGEGKVLLEEAASFFPKPPARQYRAVTGNLYHIDARFNPQPDEHLYGLGQHQNGLLDQKGCVVELSQRNTEVCIPFLLSSRGYGFLWNNPAVGRVELGMNGTRWVAEETRQMDYWITAGDSPAEILENYADATGHPLMLPEWASGFWQCKLRYSTQDELLSIARGYKERGLPLSVIVVDFFHWTMMGDWRFDPACWPDPEKMVRELEEMGVKLMVSVWPSVNPSSSNYQVMNRRGLLIRTKRGVTPLSILFDNKPGGPTPAYFYDATHPGARRFIWEQVRENYYRKGVKVWWLDACEPEAQPDDHDHLIYHLGSGLEVGCIYPLLHEQAFYDGMSGEGEQEIISLCRSAWAGSQRYGAAVWSGDIQSTFEALRVQVRAGLNIGLSGIPWWTTDIGGFYGGDTASPYFRELIVRWFQYGTFCPLFRLHGYRQPTGRWFGGPNEVWSFGEEAYRIIRELMFLRERLRPYIMIQMKVAHEKGTPTMRPLFFDFPDEEAAYKVDDQFMFGTDILVAPVLYEDARSRKVYLPAEVAWRDAWTGERFTGGRWIEAEAPLDKIPIFLRHGSELQSIFGK